MRRCRPYAVVSGNRMPVSGNIRQHTGGLPRGAMVPLLPMTESGPHPAGRPPALPAAATGPSVPRAAFPMATMGGNQLWGDELVYRNWRIQRHIYTGHCRLLDGDNVRRASGTFEACQAYLAVYCREHNLPPMQGRVVLILHGMIRTRRAMLPLSWRVAEALPAATVVCLSYPSTRASVADHAARLARVIDHLGDGVTQIDFVGHSLGNIVVRHLLGDQLRAHGDVDRRFGRMVMIAPPNRGSRRALAWSNRRLFQLVMGSPGQELSVGWRQLQERLATPPFPFGIIAGAKGDGRSWKRYLPGDDDACISVATTRLAGAHDFITVKARHTFIMYHPQVQEYTARFLAEGYFISEETRQPIVTLDDDGEL